MVLWRRLAGVGHVLGLWVVVEPGVPWELREEELWEGSALIFLKAPS